MRDWAERACSQNDSKARQLIAWLKEHIRPNGEWTDQRVILFTEYRATQKWLSEVMSSEGFTGQDRLMTMYGGMDAKGREGGQGGVPAAPDHQPRPHPAERPTPPRRASTSRTTAPNSYIMRFRGTRTAWSSENKHVDRHGQKADRVKVFHFVTKGYKARQKTGFAVPASDLEARP